MKDVTGVLQQPIKVRFDEALGELNIMETRIRKYDEVSLLEFYEQRRNRLFSIREQLTVIALELDTIFVEAKWRLQRQDRNNKKGDLS